MDAKNILFFYLYRDGDNYKRPGAVVFANPEALDLVTIQSRLESGMEGGHYFIAGQVGVPEVFLFPKYEVNDADHCWHEWGEVEETGAPVTDPRTIGEFIAEVDGASKTGWKEFDPLKRSPAELLAAIGCEETRVGCSE